MLMSIIAGSTPHNEDVGLIGIGRGMLRMLDLSKQECRFTAK